MAQKPTISLAIATFNKDQYVMHTLASVYDWVDEIIIVYGSPKDELIAALEKYDTDKKITYHITDNPPMFHINKQKAIDRCTKDWILQLDTDEVVSPELRDEILATMSNHKGGDPVGYWMPRLNYFLGRPLRKGGQYPDPTIRLYMNGHAHLPCKSVHEQAEVDGPVGNLKHDLLHYPYPTFRVYLEKWTKYAALTEDSQNPDSITPGFASGVSYMVIKPTYWFLKTYFRHRGYTDGFAGFAFSLFSALRYWVTYIQSWEQRFILPGGPTSMEVHPPKKA